MMMLATACQSAIRAEAYRGEPYGIGRISVDLSPGASTLPWGDDRFALVESDGRAMYPVLENAPVRRLVRKFLGIETPWQVTFYFMFRGDEPLHLTVYAPAPSSSHSTGVVKESSVSCRTIGGRRTRAASNASIAKPNIRCSSKTTWRPPGRGGWDARCLNRACTCCAKSNGAIPGSRN
jgi:hypothetical protein